MVLAIVRVPGALVALCTLTNTRGFGQAAVRNILTDRRIVTNEENLNTNLAVDNELTVWPRLITVNEFRF